MHGVRCSDGGIQQLLQLERDERCGVMDEQLECYSHQRLLVWSDDVTVMMSLFTPSCNYCRRTGNSLLLTFSTPVPSHVTDDVALAIMSRANCQLSTLQCTCPKTMFNWPTNRKGGLGLPGCMAHILKLTCFWNISSLLWPSATRIDWLYDRIVHFSGLWLSP